MENTERIIFDGGSTLSQQSVAQLQQIFQNRSASMKTRGGVQRIKEHALYAKSVMQGMTASEYWTTQVKSRADMQAYYQALHPEYPETLIEAICDRVQALVDKYNTNGQTLDCLTEAEQRMLVRSVTQDPITSSWNPERDIHKELLKAKMGGVQVCKEHLPGHKHDGDNEYAMTEESQVEEEDGRATNSQTYTTTTTEDPMLQELENRLRDELHL